LGGAPNGYPIAALPKTGMQSKLGSSWCNCMYFMCTIHFSYVVQPLTNHASAMHQQ
jgi:hypothetical protein